MVEAGFHGAEGGVGDAGDFGEREIFEDVQEEDGALGKREGLDEGEESVGLFALEDLLKRVVGGGVGEVFEGAKIVGGSGIGIAGTEGGRRLFEAVGGEAGAAEVLDAALVGDAEEPGGEAGVVAEGGEVADRGGEGFLDEVEGGGVVADEFGDVGVERELVGFEKLIPGVEVVCAGGAEEGGVWGEGGHAGLCSVECVRG